MCRVTLQANGGVAEQPEDHGANLCTFHPPGAAEEGRRHRQILRHPKPNPESSHRPHVERNHRSRPPSLLWSAQESNIHFLSFLSISFTFFLMMTTIIILLIF